MYKNELHMNNPHFCYTNTACLSNIMSHSPYVAIITFSHISLMHLCILFSLYTAFSVVPITLCNVCTHVLVALTSPSIVWSASSLIWLNSETVWKKQNRRTYKLNFLQHDNGNCFFPWLYIGRELGGIQCTPPPNKTNFLWKVWLCCAKKNVPIIHC